MESGKDWYFSIHWALVSLRSISFKFTWNIQDLESRNLTQDLQRDNVKQSIQFICNFITFACLQELFQLINERNTKYRFPSPLLAVDQTLYLFCGVIGFKQHNPKKATKYGLLYRSLCNSSVPYKSNPRPYAQKPEVRTVDSSKYYVTGKDEYKK